jgi:AcrR family transcriptional regulator
MSGATMVSPLGATPGELATNGAGLNRDRLSDFQRARLLAAMMEVAVELGAPGATVARVVARAGVSRRTFYELFADREECFLAALDAGLERIVSRVVPAYWQERRWRERIRAALVELLLVLDRDRMLASLVIVQTLAAGSEALERRARVLLPVIAAIEQGADGKGDPQLSPEVSRLTAEGVVGAVLSVLHTRLLEDLTDRSLCELVNPLMSVIVLPYLGPAAARRELSAPAPSCPELEGSRSRLGGSRSNPLKGLGIRLTYRTVRVLGAVAEIPGASNRTVGTVAGIADQGQVSKLLARLQGTGLVANRTVKTGRGAPNAWTLTARGQEVRDALAACTAPS